jgi:hypothetical protein
MCSAGASILAADMVLTPGRESSPLMARGVVPANKAELKIRGKRTAHLAAIKLAKLEQVSLSAQPEIG